MRQLDFFNTTHLKGDELKAEQVNAQSQEGVVLSLFSAFYGPVSPEDIHIQYCYIQGKENTPITSIRRAISNLTSKGLLVMTDVQTISKYGKKQNTWKKA